MPHLPFCKSTTPPESCRVQVFLRARRARSIPRPPRKSVEPRLAVSVHRRATSALHADPPSEPACGLWREGQVLGVICYQFFVSRGPANSRSQSQSPHPPLGYNAEPAANAWIRGEIPLWPIGLFLRLGGSNVQNGYVRKMPTCEVTGVSLWTSTVTAISILVSSFAPSKAFFGTSSDRSAIVVGARLVTYATHTSYIPPHPASYRSSVFRNAIVPCFSLWPSLSIV